MVLLTAFAVINIAAVLYTHRHEYNFIWSVWKRFRVAMFLEAVAVLIATIIIGVLLSEVPPLKYGWLHLVYTEGGNVLVRPLTAGSDSAYELVRWLPVLFVTGLLLAVPFLAKMEEEQFRKGYTEWSDILAQSVKFGLVHCIVGIPLAFGIALILSGLWYGYHYRLAYMKYAGDYGHKAAEEEAVMVSTTYHSMYNSIIACVLIACLIP